MVQTYECSSATTFRTFQLRMFPVGRGVLMVHTPIEQRPHDREPEPPDESVFRDGHRFISQCCNCRRTRQPERRSWHWIPAWVNQLPDDVTHVLCPPCFGYLYPLT
jgi:hypothetical protein